MKQRGNSLHSSLFILKYEDGSSSAVGSAASSLYSQPLQPDGPQRALAACASPGQGELRFSSAAGTRGADVGYTSPNLCSLRNACESFIKMFSLF